VPLRQLPPNDRRADHRVVGRLSRRRPRRRARGNNGLQFVRRRAATLLRL